jgi:hypothetical protein
VFVATVPVERGSIALPELAPGAYLVEPFADTEFRTLSFGLSGRSFDTVIPIRIAADGSVDPAQLELPANARAEERPR